MSARKRHFVSSFMPTVTKKNVNEDDVMSDDFYDPSSLVFQ